jgi:hypothetical protein
LTRRVPERRGEPAGKQRGHHAVQVRHAHAEADEREHVQAAARDGLYRANVEWPRRPQTDWCSEREFDERQGPRANRGGYRVAWQVVAHGEDEQGNCEARG